MAKANLMKTKDVSAPVVNNDNVPLGLLSVAVQWDAIEDNKATATPTRRRGMFAKLAEAVGIGRPDKEGTPADLDLAVVAFDAMRRALAICYFGNTVALDGALKHTGDEQTGEAEGWDETVIVDLNSDEMDGITYIVPILMAFKEGVSLGAVNNVAFATLAGPDKTSPTAGHKFRVEVDAGFNGLLLCRYDLNETTGQWEGTPLEMPAPIEIIRGTDPKKAIADACRRGLPGAA